MKIIEDYCRQIRRYGDSEGWLKIELESEDDRQAIIDKYHKVKSMWYDEECIFKPDLSTDTLLVFKRQQDYLD